MDVTKKTEAFNRQNTGFASDTILGMTEIKNRGICFINQKEIGIYDKKTKKITSWPIPIQQDFGDFAGMDAIAIDLHERNNGELMWGDRKNIFFFNLSSHSFRTVSLPTVAYLGIRWIRTGADGYEYLKILDGYSAIMKKPVPFPLVKQPANIFPMPNLF